MPRVIIGNNYPVNMGSATWLESYFNANFVGGTLYYSRDPHGNNLAYSNAFIFHHEPSHAEIFIWGSFTYQSTGIPYNNSPITGLEIRDGGNNLIVDISGLPSGVTVGTVLNFIATGSYSQAFAYIDSLLDGRPLHIEGSNFNDTLVGHTGNDDIWGESGNDNLQGGAGHDYLDGGTGIDVLSGGTGNDDYIQRGGDTISEGFGGGTDEVLTYVNYTLPTYVENLFLHESKGGLRGTGNAGNNLLDGNGAGNILKGLGGKDTLDGEGGADQLFGGDAADVLLGGAANDILDGGGGTDQMTGGPGNDIYFVNSGSDVVKEVSGGGSDTVKSTAGSYTLAAQVEKLILLGGGNINGTGNGGNNVITGNGGNNTLTGAGGNDTLNGGSGNDTLAGSAGKDTMSGGGGDDLYKADAGDVINELAGAGYDTVQSSVNHTLRAFLDQLILGGGKDIKGTGNGLDNVIQGNGGANVLNGGGGNDTLTGGAGKDTLLGGAGADSLDGGTGGDSMSGGGGDDIYVVDAPGDKVKESADAGFDTVLSSVTRTLEGNVDHLTLTGANAIDGTGNELDNTITGNDAGNVLDGKAGADMLDGGGGDDTLVWDAADAGVSGGAGTDTLRLVGDAIALDLTTIGVPITSVEQIDITGGTGAANSLTLTDAEVLAISDTDTLRIDGDALDVVNAGTGWTDGGVVTPGYHTYTHTSGATLLVDTEILTQNVFA